MNKRYKLDKVLEKAGISAIFISCAFLFVLLLSIFIKASAAFTIYEIKVSLNNIPTNEKEAVGMLRNFVAPEENELEFFSIVAGDKIINSKDKEVWLPASAKINDAISNNDFSDFSSNAKEFIKKLQAGNLIKKKVNLSFFMSKESREPELAGILTSLVGTLYTMFVCLLVGVPVAVCTAIYLEEFASKNLITTLIEININNLAAVPSIVFGLLGLAILINVFDFPRSSAITAGITLAIMVIPSMIITTRQAFRTIPINIKNAALALGATKMQIIMHHSLPLAVPGIMTGVILSIARAIGETAPLIMIGMLAFIVDVPKTIFDPTTVMPVQIFLWADSPERAFQAKTSAAILVLLFILILINSAAFFIRKKYQRKW